MKEGIYARTAAVIFTICIYLLLVCTGSALLILYEYYLDQRNQEIELEYIG